MLKRKLLALSLAISGCAHLPPQPEIVQYGIYADVNPPGFYGVNNKSKERVYRRFDDPRMKAGQCLDRRDYQETEEWVRKVADLAKQRCN